ncbi:MAG: hypothetical protein V3U02_06605 [Calditrichia bacterium]
MAKKKIISILFILVGGLLAIGSIGAIIAGYEADDDGDGSRNIIDSDDTGGTGTSTSDSTTISGGVDLNNDGDYNDAGDINPPATADKNIIITSMHMDSLYNADHRLNSKIFLLEPGQEFNQYVTIEPRGGEITGNICVFFELLEGSLVGPFHKAGATRLSMSKDCFENLDNEATLVLKGRVPNWRPGHDWHLGKITVEVDNERVIAKTNPRIDEPAKPRWLTKKYPTDWCGINTELLEGCIETTITSKDITIGLNQDDFKLSLWTPWDMGSNVNGRIVVTQLTYPGKALKVFDGKPSRVQLIGNIWEVKLDNVDMVSVEPNEAYLKITMWDSNGDIIDLNNAVDDASARVNIGTDIVGTKAWAHNTEYFNMLGVLKGFSTVGGNHPESQWFS